MNSSGLPAQFTGGGGYGEMGNDGSPPLTHHPSLQQHGVSQLAQHGGQLAQHGGGYQQHAGGQQLHQQYNNGTGAAGKQCAGCGFKIEERYLLLAMDRYWHHSCLKCCYCSATLADLGASCFSKRGMILCKGDYARIFGGSANPSSASGNQASTCSACGQSIPPGELVMRAPTTQQNAGQHPNTSQPNTGQSNVFHLQCFMCSKCGAQLRQGDRYYMLAGSLVCEQDWQKMLKSSSNTTGSTVRKGKVGRPRRSRD